MKPPISLALALLAAAPAFAQTAAAPDQPPSAPPAEKVAPPEPVRAQALRAPDLFSADAGPTGLPQTIWRGASADLARIVIPALAQKPLSPAAAAFAHRLLATGAQAPDGAGADTDLAAARIAAVLGLGDVGGAQAMLAHTPGVSNSPALSQDAAEIDLVLAQEDQACAVGDALTQGKDEPYWRRLRAYCLVRAGKTDEAQLAFDLAASQAKDDIYKRLMSAAVSGTPAGEADLRNGVDFALSRRLTLDLTPALPTAWTPILATLSSDQAYPPDLRAAASARLKASGPNQPPDIAAPVLIPLLAGDLKSAEAARAGLQRDDASGATVLELALIDAALTTAEGRVEGPVMDQLVERGTAGEAKDRALAQAAAALYAAEGAPMTSQGRVEFAGFDLGRPPGSEARLLEMEMAVASGDAALLGLWMAADAGPAGPPPAERAAIVHAWTRAGFPVNARAYALEGLLNLLAPPPPPPAPRAAAPVRRRPRRAQP